MTNEVALGATESEEAARAREERAKYPTPPETKPYTETIMQYFAYTHLPPHLQEVSKPFGELAQLIERTLPRGPERTVALRKLLEGKDAAVRAMLTKPSAG